MTTKKIPSVWSSILKCVLGIVISILASQIATTNQAIKNQVIEVVRQTGNTLIDVYTAKSSDTTKTVLVADSSQVLPPK
jgi:hypothetical protein